MDNLKIIKYKVLINDVLYGILSDNLHCDNTVNGVSGLDIVISDIDNHLDINDLETDTFIRLIGDVYDLNGNLIDSHIYMDGLIDHYTLTTSSGINFYNLKILGLIEVLKDTLIDKYYEDYSGSFQKIIDGIIKKEIENDEIFLSGVVFNVSDFEISEVSINESLFDFLIRLSDEFKFNFYIDLFNETEYKLVISNLSSTPSFTFNDDNIIYFDERSLTLSNDGGSNLFSDIRYSNAYYPSDSKYKDVIYGNGSTKRFDLKYNPYLVDVTKDIIIKVQMTPSSPILTVPSNLIGYTDVDYENEDDFAYYIQRKEDDLFDIKLLQSGSNKKGVVEYCITLDETSKLIIEYIYGVQIKQDYQNIATRNKLRNRSKGIRRKKVKLIDDFVFGKSKIDNKGLRLTTDISNKITNLEVDSFDLVKLGSVVKVTSNLNGIDDIYYVQTINLSTYNGIVYYTYNLSNVVFLPDKEVERLNKLNKTSINNRIGNSGFSGGTSRIVSNKMIFNIVDNTPNLDDLVQCEGFLNRNIKIVDGD